jgi:NADH:ubiquinone oxidoreductase subunit D
MLKKLIVDGIVSGRLKTAIVNDAKPVDLEPTPKEVEEKILKRLEELRQEKKKIFSLIKKKNERRKERKESIGFIEAERAQMENTLA